MCLALPAEIVALEGRTATVSVDGALRAVDVSLVDDIALGDYLLVHAGVALHRWTKADYQEWQEIMAGAAIDPRADAG